MCLIIIVGFYNCFHFLLQHHLLFLLCLLYILVFLSLFLDYKILQLHHKNLYYMYYFLRIVCSLQNINIECQQVEHFLVFLLLLLHTQFFRSPGVNNVTILSASPMLLSTKTIPLVFIIPIYFTYFLFHILYS